jgi:HAD superfamily phosphoserine phosphatase-like hydrolase
VSYFRAVVLDLDDTLTVENSFSEILRELDVPPADFAAFSRACRSEALDRSAAEHALFTLLTSYRSRVTRDAVDAVFHRIGLQPAALPLLSAITDAGCQVGLISSSFDRYVSIMADRLGVGDHYANIRMEFDAVDTLCGLGFTLDVAGLKHRQLHHFCQLHGLAPSRVLVVGDNFNDVEMFTCTGNGVLVDFPHNHKLRANAWQVVTTLDQVTRLLHTGRPEGCS